MYIVRSYQNKLEFLTKCIVQYTFCELFSLLSAHVDVIFPRYCLMRLAAAVL